MNALRTRDIAPVTRVTGWAVLTAAMVVTAFFLVVRGEPRIDLALSGLVVAAVGIAILLGVRFAAVAAVALGLFMVLFPALRKYYAFSLERPGELVGFVFTVVALVVAGVVLVTATVASVVAVRPVEPLSGGAAAVVSAVVGLVAAAAGALLFAGQAQPDQSEGLTMAQVDALPEIVMDDFRYTPDRVQATAGDELALRVRNDDVESYRFTIDALDVDVIVPSGRTAVVRFTPTAAGTLEFYSAEEGGEHRDLGMVGQVEVSP